MSRALNLTLLEAEVLRQCVEARIEVSAIEPLMSGGTHLVCKTGEGANEARQRFEGQLIEGSVRRLPFYRPNPIQYAKG
jgi:hypothetical protein